MEKILKLNLKTFSIMWSFISNIQDWFTDFSERRRLVRNFNLSARDAFVSSLAPTLLESSISMGESAYRHAFSKFMAGGFRIKALSGRPLNRQEMVSIAQVVLSNQELVRKLISLGWDTLEVHDNAGYNGIKYKLYDHSGISGLIG
jgi:hypothetical protein